METFPHSLPWRHNDHDDVSNHQPHSCLRNRLFRRRSKKTSKLRVTGLCAGNSPGPVNSPHKGPVTRKMFPFDDGLFCCVVGNHRWLSDSSHKGPSDTGLWDIFVLGWTSCWTNGMVAGDLTRHDAYVSNGIFCREACNVEITVMVLGYGIDLLDVFSNAIHAAFD